MTRQESSYPPTGRPAHQNEKEASKDGTSKSEKSNSEIINDAKAWPLKITKLIPK